MRKVYISPSLLAVKVEDFKKEIDKVISLGIKYLHFDVMDKEFIGHTSFSFDDFKHASSLHHLINDVHIMVSTPFEYAKEYAKLGANIITFHYEAINDDFKRYDLISAIKKLGVKVGISIKPKTPVDKVLPFLHLVDLILIMSVEPGKGGQSFIYDSLEKIHRCREYIDSNHLKTLIEVDGGINDSTGPSAFYSGADILVAGSYLFNKDDMKERYLKLLGACSNG